MVAEMLGKTILLIIKTEKHFQKHNDKNQKAFSERVKLMLLKIKNRLHQINFRYK